MKDFQHEDPENWKWGVIYFNRKDFRFLVPKRDPVMGWTFNFFLRTGYVVVIMILGSLAFQFFCH